MAHTANMCCFIGLMEVTFSIKSNSNLLEEKQKSRKCLHQYLSVERLIGINIRGYYHLLAVESQGIKASARLQFLWRQNFLWRIFYLFVPFIWLTDEAYSTVFKRTKIISPLFFTHRRAV